MSVNVCNNKRRGRGALAKNAGRCLNRQKRPNERGTSYCYDLLSRNPLSRGEILDEN